jgi:hypothetical protein
VVRARKKGVKRPGRGAGQTGRGGAARAPQCNGTGEQPLAASRQPAQKSSLPNSRCQREASTGTAMPAASCG